MRLISALDRVLTPRCRLCHAPCDAQHSAGQGVLCATCHAAVFAPRARCPQCALASPAAHVCGACLREVPAYDATACAADYDASSRALLLDFKFNDQPGLAAFFATQLQHALTPLLEATAPHAIVPVPLSRERLKARGFDQALELARHLHRLTGLPLASAWLHRPVNTAPQSSLALAKRHKNMRGAFVCLAAPSVGLGQAGLGPALQGKHVLLVDDIMTSGATLNEAAATLKLHGAARVSCAVVMRTPA